MELKNFNFFFNFLKLTNFFFSKCEPQESSGSKNTQEFLRVRNRSQTANCPCSQNYFQSLTEKFSRNLPFAISQVLLFSKCRRSMLRSPMQGWFVDFNRGSSADLLRHCSQISLFWPFLVHKKLSLSQHEHFNESLFYSTPCAPAALEAGSRLKLWIPGQIIMHGS